MTDFFISYTQADREWAEWIAWVLEEAGYTTRIQAWDIPPGSNFAHEMQKATTECKRTLAVLSPAYLDSRFGAAEWLAAFVQDPTGESGKLVTVRVREVTPPGLLASLVYIDLVGLNEAAARERLLRDIAPGRRKPTKKPKFPGGPAPHFPGAAATEPDASRLEDLPLDKIPDPAPLPPGSRMPHPANPMFVGRDEDLRILAKALKAGESAAIGQVAAATGLGGIGKTQLASEFVHRYGQYFEGGVFWMSFADPAGVPAEVAACGRLLDLHPQFNDLPLEQQVQLVRDSWLGPLPRLLVFDNCEEPDLLKEWRPTTGRARVLLTSRRARWDPVFGIHSHALETLSRPASIELLRRFRPGLPEDGLTLGAIAHELGDLPLALHLAGSFLQRYQHADFGRPKSYLGDLRRGDLLNHMSLQGERIGNLPTGHAAHVARTFALSYKRLDSDDQVDALAQRLLARTSYFAHGEPIPRKLLTATLGPEASEKPIDAEEALGRLVDLGLLQQGEDGRVSMHRLVAHFARYESDDSDDRFAVEEAVLQEARLLNHAGYPGDLSVWQTHLRFVVEAGAVREDEIAASLCNNLDFYLCQTGDFVGARRYSERALEIREKVLGSEHPETARSLNNLGSLLQELGELSGARSYYDRALAIREKVLGSEHPGTALSLNNLGSLLQELGDLSGARFYCERALTIWEKVLGPEHPHTALSLNNMGSLIKELGDLSGARSYYDRALAIREKVLSPVHPDTASILNNLGTLLYELGDLPGARPYFERALAIQEKVLGPEHPDTALSLNNLGSLLEAQGDLSGARTHYERALEILTNRLGPDHPRTKITQRNLELLLKKLPDPDSPLK